MVMKCRPGAPPASSSSDSVVASSTPAARTSYGVVGDLVQAVRHERRQRGAGQVGEPFDLADPRHRHDAGDDRQVAAERPDPRDEVEVALRGEEELGDREARAGPRLGHQDASVQVGVTVLRVQVGERRHADAEVAEPGDELDQLGRVPQALGVRLPRHGRSAGHVAADRHDVPDPDRRVRADHVPQLLAALARRRSGGPSSRSVVCSAICCVARTVRSRVEPDAP